MLVNPRTIPVSEAHAVPRFEARASWDRVGVQEKGTSTELRLNEVQTEKPEIRLFCALHLSLCPRYMFLSKFVGLQKKISTGPWSSFRELPQTRWPETRLKF